MKPELVQASVKHLRSADPVLKDLIRKVGPCNMRRDRDRFRTLLRSIISQQISTKAALSIRRRVEGLVAPEKPSPENMRQLSTDELRSAGVSAQKAGYLLDLSAKVGDGTVNVRHIGRKSDEGVIEELIQIKGIGRWTAQMFLMFSLGRPDVFPHDDLGIRSALKRLYGLDDLPDKQTSLEIAEPWRPFATVASWYCWRSGDLE